MTKYSYEFKTQVIHDAIDNDLSSGQLAAKYHLDIRMIRKWIQRYRMQGISSLKHRQGKRVFDAQFKWNVINYYQTHEESMTQVAAKYDILPFQISIWRKAFLQDGYPTFKPHRKGRPPKVHKKTKKQLKHLAEKSENDRLREELARTKKELHETRLDRDILKKSLALFGPLKPDEKHK